MDTAYNIGQHLFAGFEGYTVPEDFATAIRKYQIGNIILFAHNVQSAKQLHQLCADLRELVLDSTGTIPFIAIDQEGGVVSRLSQDATIMPSAMAVAATGDPQNAYQAGLITARELKAMGVNFNLAPVMDVNSNPANPVIGVRSYGEDPQTVIRYALEMARGLQDGGVLCCAKHFPGHGDTAVDSHYGLPVVDKPLVQLKALELAPFQAAIDAGIPGIMSTHILFPQLESDQVPATMSRRIMTDLLKRDMGFQGLVLSDCMMMGAIREHFGTLPGMVAALKAGVDLIFASHSADIAGEAAVKMAEEVKNGAIDPDELTASTQKILRYKQLVDSTPVPPLDIVGSPNHREAAQNMYQDSLTLPAGQLPPLGDNPFFVGCLPYLTTPAVSAVTTPLSFADHMQAAFGSGKAIMPENPQQADVDAIQAAAQGHTCLVIGTYNAHLRRGQLQVVQALATLDIPLICVALRNPYDLEDLPAGAFGIAAYAYNPQVLSALEKRLRS